MNMNMLGLGLGLWVDINQTTLIILWIMPANLFLLGISMRWGNVLICRPRRVFSAPTLLIVPPSYIWLVIPMGWRKNLICKPHRVLSAPTLLRYKLRLIVGLPCRLVSLGGCMSGNRLCRICSQRRPDGGCCVEGIFTAKEMVPM